MLSKITLPVPVGGWRFDAVVTRTPKRNDALELHHDRETFNLQPSTINLANLVISTAPNGNL